MISINRLEITSSCAIEANIKAPIYFWLSLGYPIDFTESDFEKFKENDLDTELDFSFDNFVGKSVDNSGDPESINLYTNFITPYLNVIGLLCKLTKSELSNNIRAAVEESLIKAVPIAVNVTRSITMTIAEYEKTYKTRLMNSRLPEMQSLYTEIDLLLNSDEEQLNDC